MGAWVSPLLRELGEMHYLQTTPVILDDAKLRRFLGGSPEDSVPRRNPEDDGMIRVATVSCRVTGLAKPGTARSRRRAA